MVTDIILWDGVYVRQELIAEEELERKLFMMNAVRQDICQDCSIFLNRQHLEGDCGFIEKTSWDGSLVLDKCDNFIASAKLYYLVQHNGVSYWRMPRDCIYRLQEYFGLDYANLSITDKRRLIPFSKHVTDQWRINFDLLFDYQVKGVDDLLDAAGEFGQRGSINAQPRTGKTLMMLTAIWQLGHKTIIMANEHILLENFLDDARDFSNAGELLDSGVPLIGVCTTLEDFQKYDIALCIPHIFYKNDSLYAKVRSMFSVLVLDEVHRANSPRWSDILDGFVVTDYLTASATFARKDLRHFVMEHMCGPPVSFVEAESVSPICHLHYDEKWKPPQDFTNGKRALNFYKWSVTYGPKVVELAKQVLVDLKKGHKILLPLLYIDDVIFFADLFKRLNLTVGVIVGKANKKRFSGYETDIKKVVSNAKNGEYDVTLAIRSKIQAGVTCWRWSAHYVLASTSNEYNMYQESKRVASPAPKGEFKPQPIMRYFVDECTLPKKWLGDLIRKMFDVYSYQWVDNHREIALRLAKTVSRYVEDDVVEDLDYDDVEVENPFARKTRVVTEAKPKGLRTPAQIAELILEGEPTQVQKKTKGPRNSF